MVHYIPRASRVYRVGSRGYKGRTRYHTRQFRSRLLNAAFIPHKGTRLSWNVPEVRHRGKLGTWVDLSKMTPRQFAQSRKLYRSLSKLTHQSLMSYERKAHPTMKQSATIGTDFGMQAAAARDWQRLYGRPGRRLGHSRALRKMYHGKTSRLPIVRTLYSYAGGKPVSRRASIRRTSAGGK